MINEGIKPIFRMINPPTRRRSPYRDLATSHGISAALKAEEPQIYGMREVNLGCPEGPWCDCGMMTIELSRDAKRAARKVRMARKRRRGW